MPREASPKPHRGGAAQTKRAKTSGKANGGGSTKKTPVSSKGKSASRGRSSSKHSNGRRRRRDSSSESTSSGTSRSSSESQPKKSAARRRRGASVTPAANGNLSAGAGDAGTEKKRHGASLCTRIVIALAELPADFIYFKKSWLLILLLTVLGVVYDRIAGVVGVVILLILLYQWARSFLHYFQTGRTIGMAWMGYRYGRLHNNFDPVPTPVCGLILCSFVPILNIPLCLCRTHDYSATIAERILNIGIVKDDLAASEKR